MVKVLCLLVAVCVVTSPRTLYSKEVNFASMASDSVNERFGANDFDSDMLGCGPVPESPARLSEPGKNYFNASQGPARLAPFSNLKLKLEGLVNVVMGLRLVCFGLDSPAHLITIRTTNQTKHYLITYVKVRLSAY